VCVNCVDRHLEKNADKTAIIWQGDDPDQNRHISYQELYNEVCKLSNAMEASGVTKGDRVIIYMPMVPEAAYAMLACARIGAVHSVVFGGFSANAIADRVVDCGAKMIITADEGIRGSKSIPLKKWIDDALENEGTDCVETVLVTKCTGADIPIKDRDVWYHDFVAPHKETHDAVVVNAEDPLFVLYTSGSTGKPKGLQHSSGGYLVYAATTFSYAFDYKEDDIYWCTADVGWITGHSYIIYGPLASGATTLMFEGVPTYPSLGRFGEVVDQHNVTIFYTAPTAIRILMADADTALNSSKRNSLRIIGSVGEPINPEVWQWYSDEFGKGQCPVVDTWWQTETGGFMITPLPNATKLKPGAASTPFFGIQPALVDSETSKPIEGEASGHLVVLDSWPGQSRTIWNNHERFIETYFSTHDGMYFCGDGSKRDADGYYWITGRVDDVLNVSGHRLGTAELESACVAHEAVVEAAVVGYPHDIKGQGIYIYMITKAGVDANDELKKEVKQCIIQWTDALPKTRSGKIMRRILRKIAANDFAELGDTSTLADPSVVDSLIEHRINR